MDRKKFITVGGRYLLLSGLFILGGAMIFRKHKYNGEDCDTIDFCQQCKEFSACGLPKALKYKS